MRLIDADALKHLMAETLEAIKKNPKMDNQEAHVLAAFATVGEMIDNAPTVDKLNVCGKCKWMRRALGLEQDLPTAQTEQSGWIPVTEGLPPVDEYGNSDAVLVTIGYGEEDCKYKFVYVANWCEKDYMRYWRIDDEIAEDVLAWMPLPKPWEGETNE